MARNDMTKFLIPVMVMVSFIAVSVRAQSCEFHPSQLPWQHHSTKSEFSGLSYNLHDMMMSIATTHTQLAQLKEVVTLIDKEIDKLQATIQFVLPHLSKLQVEQPIEINHVSTPQHQNPSTPPEPNKAEHRTRIGDKRPVPDSREDDFPPDNKRLRKDDVSKSIKSAFDST